MPAKQLDDAGAHPADASDSNATPPHPIHSDSDSGPGPPILTRENTVCVDTAKEETEPTYTVALPSRKSPEEVEAFNEKFKKDPLGIYLAVRAGGVEAITKISSEIYSGALWHCVYQNKPEHLATFVKDAIVILDERPSKIRGRKIVEVLFSTVKFKRMLSKADIITLLRCLKRHDQLRFLSTFTRTTLTRALLQYQPDKLDKELLDLLLPILMDKLPTLVDHKLVSQRWVSSDALESTASGIAVPRILWPLYRVAVRLALLGDMRATDLVAALVDRQLIDSQAIQDTDLTSTDLVYVVLSVLLRSCLKYGWFTRATTLLMTVVSTAKSISPPLALLVEDWLSRALKHPRAEDLQSASSMIDMLFRRGDGYVLPTDILHRFYDAVFDHDMPELAETVYHLSRNARDTSYPPPRNASLVRLMVFLGTESRNAQLARLLVQQVVDDNIHLARHVRASFIAQSAIFGLASPARALWERYSAGPDALYVVGNASTMLRMVSLFSRVADQTKAAVERRHPAAPDAHRENLEGSASSDDQEAVYPPTSSRTLSKGLNLPASDAPPSSEATTPPPHPHSDSGEPPSSDGSDASAEGKDGTRDRIFKGFDTLSYAELLAREADLRAFAARVYDAYRETKLPLESATHYDLTSLARGASILRRDSEALDVFLLLKGRGMKMDTHDVNLALGMVARADPAAGARYIQKMGVSGVQPDAVSFGTVIHWAAHHGDAALVRSLIRQAKDAGIEDLTFKTLASLLHATVSGRASQDTSPQARLKYAEVIVNMMLKRGVQPSPTVGWDCIIAALTAHEPKKAFTFWRLYVQGKVDARDNTQVRIRGSIAGQLRQHAQEGWLKPEAATVMLYELGFENEAFRLARHRRSRPSAAELEAADAGDARKG
ncbi:hypothetical protein TRAPUB_10632 [Trametes pubescens]|uniref:Uncharacterized protein n=1 Tax=Trametes pubescens TaxID=154538 RepID=A0A1M2VYW4_TRAPU|nr:hypothetical protein TRAPUB_10632 [Trametes pubescens]